MIIKSDNPLVQNSVSIDFEWIPFEEEYSHDKTQITSAAFCSNDGERTVLHISRFKQYPNPERKLIKIIIENLNKFNLTFGWYSTGVRKYNEKRNKCEGHYSDLFLLHQRCVYHGIEDLSPIILGQRISTPYFKDNNKKHIDLYKIYSKEIIKNGVFNKKYRTDTLDDVAQTLLGIGKYSYTDPTTGQKIIVTGENVNDLPLDKQMRYVARDAELTMMLAYYNDCIALEIMKYIALYSEMDFHRCCYVGITQWYSNIYNNMIQRGECVLQHETKIPKQYIAGGNSIQPKRGFYKNQPVDELDVKGMYPSISIEHNISFETVNCQCCENDQKAQVPSEVMAEINNSLVELKKDVRNKPYWVCHRRAGAFPLKLQELIAERAKYQTMLKEERSKPVEQQKDNNIIQYEVRQTALKLLANAGYGAFAREEFDFSDYRVSELITGYGRLIHKRLKMIASEKYGFDTIFGFTDSIFIKNASIETINNFITEFKQKFNVTLEHKNRFTNTIIFDKKNRFIAWNGKAEDKPILKNLDGMSGRYPKWIKKQIAIIAIHLIIEPDVNILPLIKQSFDELESGRVDIEELRFTTKLSKEPSEYVNKNDRVKILGLQFGAHKGYIVYWYESDSKKRYSTHPADISIKKYKEILWDKIEDMLAIAGYKVDIIKQQLIIDQSKVTPTIPR
jgi:DNA polymerase elongation subunit (family B)